MLSMKTLRVAIAAMVSALLLGPGMVLAEVTNLSARAPAATTFAAETLQDTTTTVTSETATGAKYFNIDGGDGSSTAAADNLDVIFRPGLNLDADDEYHFRIELHGMIFRAAPVMGSGDTTPGANTGDPRVSPTGFTDWTDSVLRNGVGSNVAVFEVTAALTTISEVKIELSEALAVGSLNPASYGIMVTMHRDQFDAIDGVGAVASGSVGGMATLVRVVNAIGADVANGRATASVDVDYLWFVGPANTAELGTAAVNMRTIAGTMIRDARAANGGEEVAAINDPDANVTTGLVAASGVSVNIEGDTSIGAFELVEKEENTPAPCATTLPAAGHSAENPLTGIEALPAPNTNTKSGLTTDQMYALCVNVDTAGPNSNSNPIEAQTFTANVSVAPGPNTVWGEARSVLLGSGTIGTIGRDGTHKRVTYLTASDKYNQRLIIVNHSGKMVRYDLVGITTEDGTSVRLSDAAMAAKEAGLNTIMPRSQVVLRVGDILMFDGMNRAAATVTVNSNPANISVATTQVNLEDGSTDTVIY
ncbi:MAG: hypothetical protein OXI74_07030 [Rhodospirillaceae bacterium]|nr:hypothetical protein [Rhodospirillaceae bacterium]